MYSNQKTRFLDENRPHSSAENGYRSTPFLSAPENRQIFFDQKGTSSFVERWRTASLHGQTVSVKFDSGLPILFDALSDYKVK